MCTYCILKVYIMSKLKAILIRNASHFDFGGGERYPIFVSKGLQDNNISPLIVSRNKRLLEYAKKNHIPTLHGWWWQKQNWDSLNILLFPFYVLWQILLVIWYISIFIKEKPNVVHIHSKDDFIAGTIAAKLAGARVIWTDYADLKHIWLNLSIWYRNPVGKLVYLCSFLANNITVVSDSERREITRHLAKKSRIKHKIVIIYNGCEDKKAFYPKKNKHSKKFIFSIANRLVTDKGIRETIDAFTSLNKKHQDTELIIIGDGPESIDFKKQAQGNKSINFVGYQNEPFAYINDSDVFLQPTYHEGFSVALVEACMLEMPIIATSVGGNVEIIEDKKNGLLVKSKDAASLENAMKRLYEDKKLRNSIALNARKTYVNSFVLSSLVERHYIPLYRGKVHEEN